MFKRKYTGFAAAAFTTLCWAVCSLFLFLPSALHADTAVPEQLPVKDPQLLGFQLQPKTRIINLLSYETVNAAIKDGNARGLLLDLTGVKELLDGTQLDERSRFHGEAFIGPYPFESKEVSYTYKRFRARIEVHDGTAVLPVSLFFTPAVNSEDWVDRGQVVVRLKLHLHHNGGERDLGVFDTFVRFKRQEGTLPKYVRVISVLEGPLVHMIRSDSPGDMVISFKTDRPVKGAVVLSNGKTYYSAAATRKHEITVTGLQADTTYTYHLELEGDQLKGGTFRTAPKAGTGKISFAYAGDSRQGVGSDTDTFMGVNHRVMERTANMAHILGADLFVFGGDMVTGYTTSPEDFRTMFHAWKQAMAGFWRQKPVYGCMGNHECLMKFYKNDAGTILFMDRWPYETESAEAVFADEMVHPLNGPEPSDPRRPTYKESVYSFQYGPVRFISFNNNYWLGRVLTHPIPPNGIGGCPEAYIMEDQMTWIRSQLKQAQKDNTVKYIILFAQEPVFPNGGHVSDCMWYYGDNRFRAYTYDPKTDTTVPSQKGIIELRNEFVTLVSKNKKVAAVLGADEHSYHKILIHRDVPIGIPGKDDQNGDGRICYDGDSCSPLKEIKYPTWYLVSGGAGAPYYSMETTPWNAYWQNFKGEYPNHTSKKGCFYYSSQENFLLITADEKTSSLKVYSPYGEVIDAIDDLMSVKKNR